MDKLNLNDQDKQVFDVLKSAVTEDVIKTIEEKQVNRKEIFGSENNSTKELAEKKDASAEYLRKLVRGQETKALSAGSSTNGQELVPTYVSDQIITAAQKYGAIRKYARKWPMQGINENVPTMSSISAYRLTSDTSKISSSAPTTGNVQLRAKTVGVIIPVSKVLLQNATANVVDALTDLAAKGIAKLEDQWGFLGLASGEGIFQNTNVPVVTLATGNAAYNKLTAENLLDMIDVVDENFVNPDTMKWVMSLSVLNNFRRLRSVVGSDKQGFLFEGFGGQLPATMWDIPYITNAVMPKNSDGTQTSKNVLALADFDNILYGDAMEYQMEISDQATITDTDGSTLINLFQQNMVALKIWGVVDIELTNADKAFALVKTSAS